MLSHVPASDEAWPLLGDSYNILRNFPSLVESDFVAALYQLLPVPIFYGVYSILQRANIRISIH
jgi:hypothetical protein